MGEVMLLYVGGIPAHKHLMNINHIVREIVTEMEVDKPSTAKLVADIQHEIPNVKADHKLIRTMLQNLLTNSFEAAAERGCVITVTTGVVACTAEYLQSSFLFEEQLPGKYLRLEVNDTGQGMEPDVMAKMFDPFFSTRFTGRGLGMSIVLGIVRIHRGCIFVESEPGSGTKVVIVLPVDAQMELKSDQTAITTTGAVAIDKGSSN